MTIDKHAYSHTVLVVKILTANTVDTSSIPRSGSSPGGEMETHSSILVGKISWAEEPSGLQYMGMQRVEHD